MKHLFNLTTDNIIIATIAALTLTMSPALCFINTDDVPKGEVIDTVRCDHKPEQSYALYIPSTYIDSLPTPVIYIFEPGARGKLPVNLYHDIADKYGFILACSNNSRNGPIQEGYLAYLAMRRTWRP